MATTASGNNVGISLQGAKQIKQAVSEYKARLNNRSDFWLSPSGIGKRALAGEGTLKAFDAMVKSFMADNRKYINYLTQFENQIDAIIKRYQQQDSNNSSFNNYTFK